MENSTNERCLAFTDNPHQCDVIIAVRRTMGALSLFGCTFVIVTIWLFKKYIFFTQRMILYLSITALFVSIAYLMGEHVYEGTYCRFQGWFLQFFGFSLVLWVACITFNLFLNVVKMIQTDKYEIFYHVFCWGISGFISFLPFIDDQYGPAEAWCWIKSYTGWRFGIYYVPLFIVLIGMVVAYLYIVFTLKRKASAWHHTYDPDTERRKELLKRDIKPLMAYPCVYIAISIFPLVNRIQNAVNPGHPIFALVLLQAITSPLQGAVNAIVYCFDRETLNRLTPSQLKIAIQRKLHRDSGVQEYTRNHDMDDITEADHCNHVYQTENTSNNKETQKNEQSTEDSDQVKTTNQDEQPDNEKTTQPEQHEQNPVIDGNISQSLNQEISFSQFPDNTKLDNNDTVYNTAYTESKEEIIENNTEHSNDTEICCD